MSHQGLYTEQLKEWKDELIQSISEKKANSSEEKKESKKDKASIKSLERELIRKDKALAETAALLVLRTKLQAFYGRVHISRAHSGKKMTDSATELFEIVVIF